MKQTLRQGGTNALNFYSTTAGDYLGWAYLPSIVTKPGQAYLDGVVIDWESIPGTSTTYAGRYDQGETATHEVGHWLNLEHTFFGGCNAKGDFVDDTPAQKVPTNGCPEGKDTCRQPGLDPIHNYMDYSYDSCYTEFTAARCSGCGTPGCSTAGDRGRGRARAGPAAPASLPTPRPPAPGSATAVVTTPTDPRGGRRTSRDIRNGIRFSRSGARRPNGRSPERVRPAGCPGPRAAASRPATAAALVISPRSAIATASSRSTQATSRSASSCVRSCRSPLRHRRQVAGQEEPDQLVGAARARCAASTSRSKRPARRSASSASSRAAASASVLAGDVDQPGRQLPELAGRTGVPVLPDQHAPGRRRRARTTPTAPTCRT